MRRLSWRIALVALCAACVQDSLPLTVNGMVVVAPDGSKAVTIAVGHSVQLLTYGTVAQGGQTPGVGPTQWTSRQPQIASVTPSTGQVTGLAAGTATIVVSSVFPPDSLVVTVTP
jgi:hypothetical protein